ncbi:hypothetical protein FOYG_08981 [Fusarium oxysporum NRRL 32931]|uniref:alcohol dehydrogenase n=1 Tax=Fusarium oxysporum NRRL 32931 TaxID=660029 RepID=W9IHU7_FUSOX|nr:hypothetical protein FOYG_08981 [Fusarium oxysporum NRRL 32931]
MTVSTIPVVQTAAVLRGPYGVRHSIEHTWPVPSPRPGEALVRIQAASLCAGDLHLREGWPPAPPDAIRPMVLGHEAIGVIVGLGYDTETSGFHVGDQVAMGWRRSVCNGCDSCRAGRDNLCPSQQSHGGSDLGLFQEYLTVPTATLVPVPPTRISAAHLAPLTCAGTTALASIRAIGAEKGRWVAITGAAGGVGSLALKYAKHLGFRTVAIDSEAKESFCKRSNPDVFISFESQSLVETILDATDGGVHGTVVCSPASVAYMCDSPAFLAYYSPTAIEYSAPGATIVAVGTAEISFRTSKLMAKGLKLIGQKNGSRADMRDALAMANVGIVPEIEAITLDRIDSALDRLNYTEVLGRQVFVFS